MEWASFACAKSDNLVPIAQIAQVARKGGAAAPPRVETPAPPAAAANFGGEKKKASEDNGAVASEKAIALSEESLPAIWQQLLWNQALQLRRLRKIQSTAISGPNSLVIHVRAVNAPEACSGRRCDGQLADNSEPTPWENATCVLTGRRPRHTPVAQVPL